MRWGILIVVDGDFRLSPITGVRASSLLASAKCRAGLNHNGSSVFRKPLFRFLHVVQRCSYQYESRSVFRISVHVAQALASFGSHPLIKADRRRLTVADVCASRAMVSASTSSNCPARLASDPAVMTARAVFCYSSCPYYDFLTMLMFHAPINMGVRRDSAILKR
jgi:hypothetical protein